MAVGVPILKTSKNTKLYRFTFTNGHRRTQELLVSVIYGGNSHLSIKILDQGEVGAQKI